VLGGYIRLEPVEHLRQLPFEQLEFGDLLSDGVQLLCHQGVQAGPHGQALHLVQLCRQRFERGKGEPECPCAANEQQPMDIVAGVLPVSSATPAWYGQHPDLLVVANCFCWDTGGMRELADRQCSFHSCSSLYDVSGKKGTRSTRWKVKGKPAKKIAESITMYATLYTQRCYSTSSALLPRLYIKVSITSRRPAENYRSVEWTPMSRTQDVDTTPATPIETVLGTFPVCRLAREVKSW
jgi:hypothetical protein